MIIRLRPIAARSAVWLVMAGVTASMITARPSIGSDAMRGVLAVEQRLTGRGNALTEIVVANPAALEQDQREPIGWWAPGQQQILYGLRVSGLALDQTLTAAVGLSWLAGIVAWGGLFWQSVRDSRLALWLLATFALFRSAHVGAFQYTGGETMLWAAFPIAAWVNVRALCARGAPQRRWAAVSGFLAASLVILKYSGGILGIGLGAVWLWNWWRKEVPGVAVLAWAAGAAAATPGVAYSGLFALMDGATPASALGSHPMVTVLLVGAFGPLAVLADAVDIFTFASRRLGLGWTLDTAIGIIMLALGCLFAAWATMAARPRHLSPVQRAAFLQALIVTVVVALVLTMLRLRGGLVSWETRHQQYGAFLLMPFLAEALLESLRSERQRARVWAAACLVVFFGLPALYGGSLLVARSLRVVSGPSVARIDRHEAWTPDGRPALDVVREIDALPNFKAVALLATTSVRTAIAFPAKRVHLVMHSGQWRSERFSGRPAGGVALLLHPGVGEADADVLRESFTEIQRWTRVPLVSAPAAQLWLGW